MLVLTRKKHETIMIGKDVEVTIMELRGDKVRLGIKAPADVSVDRWEVRKAKELSHDGCDPVPVSCVGH